METRKPGRPWLLAAPLLLLLALFLVPTVRPLALAQLSMLFNSPLGATWVLRDLNVTKGLPEGDPETEQAALRNASLRNALDYPTQLAYSLKADWKPQPGKPDERVVRLDALAGRFPAHPTLYAHILRYATAFDVKVRRNNELRVNMYNQKPIEDISGDPDAAPPNTPDRLAEFEKYAAAGEQLEPENAYFPLMRAVGLFASHRDSEALDAIRRASRKPRWDDHINDEAEGDWKLVQQAFGEHSATLRSTLQNSVATNAIPHFEALRDVGRMAVYSAVLAEKAGHSGDGYEIRRAMMHCSSLMRVQSRTLQGSRSGVDILQDMIVRPGGAPPPDEDINLSTEQRAQARFDAYYNYLKKIGHSEEVAWIQQEIEAGKRVQTIQDKSVSASLSPYGHQVKHLNTLWMGDFVLLTNALEAMLLILTGLILSRFQAGRPMAQIQTRSLQASSLAIGMLIVFVIFTIITFQTQWGPAFGSLRAQVTEFMSNSGEISNESRLSLLLDTLTNADMVRAALMSFSLAAPVLIMIWLGIKAQMREEAFVPAVIERMARTGAIVALILMLCYTGLVILTARGEAQLHTALDRVLVSEGRYDAELIGQPWPN